jgi:predicted cupin superfamily sugar epimerase
MRQDLKAADLVRLFGMSDMETENVQYRQTWVSAVTGQDGKPLGTAIVALLTDDPSSFSDIHRLPTDEVWHFYLGDPIELLLLHPDETDEVRLLGHDVLSGHQVQTTVPAGVWMGARLELGGSFALFGNTMAPGFVIEDFEAADAEELMRLYPRRRDLIRAMTRQSRLASEVDGGGVE